MIRKSGNTAEIHFVKNHFFILTDKSVKNYTFGVFSLVVA